MYGLNHLNSAKHLRSLLTSAAAYPKRSLCLTPPQHFSHRPSNPAGTDDFGKKAKNELKNKSYKNQIPGKNEFKRKVLPPELLSKNVVMLTCDSAAHGICDVYLVGTCHWSWKSWREVRDVIKFLQPQVVFLELCSSRTEDLSRNSREDIKVALERGKLVYCAEFPVAYDEAQKYGGKVIFGDRPYDVTMQRAEANMRLWERILLIPYLPVISYFSPTLRETLIHERDQYMSAKLLEVACKHNSIVAVVGKGHLPGIQKNWKQKQPVDMEELLRVPTGSYTFITPKLVVEVQLIITIGGLLYLLYQR